MSPHIQGESAGQEPTLVPQKGTLKETTGFSPHDLPKVLRLQQSFRHDYLLVFADQSHVTHSFRAITGHTPARFRERFDV